MAVAAYLLLTKPAAAIPVPEEATTADSNAGYPLRYMTFHPDIKLLQAALGITQDGKIGPQTLHAFTQWRNGYQGIDDYTSDDVADQFPNRKALLSYVADISKERGVGGHRFYSLG